MSPMEEYLTREVDRHRRAILTQARNLAEQLTTLADRAERITEPRINDLGELQGQATMFDARCGAYGAALDALGACRRFTEAS